MYRIEGEDKKPILWPGGSLASFGKNLYGENIWRVVRAESRTYMYGGKFKDGFIGYRWIPLYMNKYCYVLERWLSPIQYAKCSPERWDIIHRDHETGLNHLGPYPARGEYFGPCWYFEGYPTLSAIATVINMIERGEEYSEAEKHQAILKAQEQEDILAKAKATEIILDSLPLSVTSGKLSNRFYKDAKDIPERLSAQDIMKGKGLPVGKNKSFTTGAKRT